MDGRQAHLGLLGRQLLDAGLVVAEQREGGRWHVVVWAGLYLHTHTGLGDAELKTLAALPGVQGSQAWLLSAVASKDMANEFSLAPCHRWV